MVAVRWVRSFLAACALATSTSAQAETLQDVQRLYAQGRFLEAARVGESLATAPALTLAARALLAQSMFNPLSEPDEPLLLAAQARAEEALARQPGSLLAQLQLAAALGLRAQLMSNGEAMAQGIAQRAQRLIATAVERAPNDPWAQALHGGWNIEAVRRGGALGAMLLGASVGAGEAAFQRAVALAPRDPAILLAYATALLMLDPQDQSARAERLLNQATACAPRDAFERLTRDRAAEAARVLRARGGGAAAQMLAAQIR
jgi:hypothetical protein